MTNIKIFLIISTVITATYYIAPQIYNWFVPTDNLSQYRDVIKAFTELQNVRLALSPTWLNLDQLPRDVLHNVFECLAKYANDDIIAGLYTDEQLTIPGAVQVLYPFPDGPIQIRIVLDVINPNSDIDLPTYANYTLPEYSQIVSENSNANSQ